MSENNVVPFTGKKLMSDYPTTTTNSETTDHMTRLSFSLTAMQSSLRWKPSVLQYDDWVKTMISSTQMVRLGVLDVRLRNRFIDAFECGGLTLTRWLNEARYLSQLPLCDIVVDYGHYDEFNGWVDVDRPTIRFNLGKGISIIQESFLLGKESEYPETALEDYRKSNVGCVEIDDIWDSCNADLRGSIIEPRLVEQLADCFYLDALACGGGWEVERTEKETTFCFLEAVTPKHIKRWTLSFNNECYTLFLTGDI